MIRGGFRVGGVFIPNQFTVTGMQAVIRAAFWQEPLDWYIGLCAHNQADSIALANINEPTGLNGYARQHVEGDDTNWPEIGVINGESFIRSRPVTFPSTGPYSLLTNRMFITDGLNVIAISTPRADGLQLTPPGPNVQYELYFR